MNKARPIAHSSILRPLTVVIARLVCEDKSVYRNLNFHLTPKEDSLQGERLQGWAQPEDDEETRLERLASSGSAGGPLLAGLPVSPRPSHNHLVLRVARRGRSFCPAETKGNSLPAGQAP